MISAGDLERALTDPHEPPPRASLPADVMRRVRLETAATPPLAFPWRRALAAAAVAVAVMAAAGGVAASGAPGGVVETALPLLWAALGAVAAAFAFEAVAAPS